jgi:hypothetical protein
MERDPRIALDLVASLAGLDERVEIETRVRLLEEYVLQLGGAPAPELEPKWVALLSEQLPESALKGVIHYLVKIHLTALAPASKETLDAFRDFAGQHRYGSVRAGAVWILAANEPDARALENDDEPFVRQIAIEGLTQLGEGR